MNRATKLTKAFAEFVGERGFEIANEEEIGQQPGEDYKLARQIFRNKQRRAIHLRQKSPRPSQSAVCHSRIYINAGMTDGGGLSVI